jgi:hypothetical protein
MLLKGLEPEFPAWAKINQRDLLSPNKANNMEESEFLKLCAEAIDESRAYSDNAMYAQTKPTKNNEFNTAKMDALKMWRKAPPKGKDPAEYAEECREGTEQLDSDGNCGFCGRFGHAAQDCLHLAASTPRTWKPVWGLWCYCRAKGRSSTPPRNAEYMKETSEFVNLAKIAKVDTSKSREYDDTIKIKPICDDEDGCYIRPTSFMGMAMQKEPSAKKGNREKSLKMLHVKIGGLIGYERDNGHIFKRRYLTLLKLLDQIPRVEII